jgi:Ca-activated chloride channel homolog
VTDLRGPRPALIPLVIVLAVLAAVALLSLASRAIGAERCALALLLAMDVSGSVSAQHFALQRDATAQALLTPPVRRAAADGLRSGVMMWGSAQHIAVPFGGDPADTAAALARANRPEAGSTDVAGAIRAGTAALLAEPCERRVLDISGDGAHSATPLSDLEAAVTAAAAAGIEINALPIVTRHDPGIADWFREHVTGPAGGFVIAATPESFARAIRLKLAMEIATR